MALALGLRAPVSGNLLGLTLYSLKSGEYSGVNTRTHAKVVRVSGQEIEVFG